MKNQIPQKTQDLTYEAVEEQQRSLCRELSYEYVPADPDSKLGFAMETQDLIPINGLRHPPQGESNGWYIWGGEEFSTDQDFFTPLHTHHLIRHCPQALKFLGLPPGYRFIVAENYVDVWFDSSVLEI